MKCDIYLIRHGESLGNFTKSFLGHTDLELTETGKAQARATAKYLECIKPDVIYSSDLKRAYQTAEPTAKYFSMPIVKDSRFREIFAGDWEGMRFDDIMVKFPESYKTWRTNIGLAACDGGESVKELGRRIVSAVTNVAKSNEGRVVFIFTHATVIRSFAAFCMGVTPEAMNDIPWALNASVTHAVYNEGGFELVEYSKSDFMGELATNLPPNV